MPQKTLVDIDSENFSLYFSSLVPDITPTQREALPKEIRFSLFKGDTFNNRNTNKLNFITKLFILWKACKKRWWIVVEDENSGLSEEQFFKLKEAVKKNEHGFDKSQELLSEGIFVTGSKELCDTFSYLNLASSSPAYKYLLRQKNTPKCKTHDDINQRKYLIRFLINYEQNKKKLTTKKQLTPAEWYVLIGLYHGETQKGAILYKETFKYCYQSSATKIKVAFGTLQERKLIVKYGENKGAKFSITSLGTMLVNEILSDLFLNI